MYAPTLELLQKYHCLFLDLHENMKNLFHLRNGDGVHFNSEGHRFITYYLMKMMDVLFVKQNKNNSPFLTHCDDKT